MRASATALALALLAATPALAVAPRAPDCAVLADFAMRADLKASVFIGGRAAGLELASAVVSPAFEHLFGVKALDWTPEDAKAMAHAVGQCARALGHQRRRAESRAVGYFAREVAQIGAVRARLDHIEAGFDRDFKALMDAPQDRDQLAALIILDHARAGGPAVQEANKFAHTITDNNDSKQIHGAAARGLNQLLADLMRAPDHLGERMYPALAQRRDALVPLVAGQQNARIDAVPATLSGLQSLPRLRQDVDRDIRLVLPAPAYQQVAAHFATRAAAIEDAVQSALLDDIAKVPAGGPGMMALDAIEKGPALAALAPPRAALVHQAVAKRRDALQDAMTAATIAQIDQFPPTLDGLAHLVGFSRMINANMAAVAGPERIKRVRDATWARAHAIATAALPGFQAALAKLSDDRDGMRGLGAQARALDAALVLMPPPIAAQYKSALADRQATIRQAVAAEDAKLEALPLAGATYVGPGGNPTIQFRNASHAYLAIGPQDKLDITYEMDGRNVILHGLPQGNLVLERHGNRLGGNGLMLMRRPD